MKEPRISNEPTSTTKGTANNNEKKHHAFSFKKKTKKHHALEIGDGRARLSMDNYLTSIA